MKANTGRGRKAAKKENARRDGKRGGRVVTASAILTAVVGLVERLITFDWDGVFTKRDLATLFVYASARRTSLTQACEDLEGAMSDSRLRQLWSRFEMRFVQPALNRLLLVHAKACLRGRGIRLAIDVTLIPYHGQPLRRRDEVYKSLAKHGTSRFHAYATAYVILKGRRLTLAVRHVRRGTRMVDVLDLLLAHVEGEGFRVDSLYVDRGFCNVACIRYLKAKPYEVLMPMIVRGRRLRRLLKTRKGARFAYTMRSAKDGTVAFDVVVAVVYAKGRRGRHRAEKYAFVALNTDAKPRTVYERYRTRFGVEASYRIMHRARARTATRNYVVRFVIFGIALLVENEWVWTKYDRLATMRRGRGGRIVHDALLRFERFLAMIVHVVNQAFGFILEVAVDGPAAVRKRGAHASSGGGGKY